MKKYLSGMLAVALPLAMAATAPATASDLDYNYAELRFVDTEIGSADGDGLRLAGSFELQDNWLLVADFSALDFDGGVDLTTFAVGAGYVHRYTEKLDIVGYAKLIRASIDTPFGDDDENGFSVAGGVRGSVTPQIEARALLTHINIDDSDTFIEVGGDYYFNKQFSAGATLEFAGDADTLTLGVRWFFGQ